MLRGFRALGGFGAFGGGGGGGGLGRGLGWGFVGWEFGRDGGLWVWGFGGLGVCGFGV